MIKESKYLQYGFPREEADIKGITIHETGSDKTAQELFNYLDNESKDSRGCHYLVDDTEVIQVMPDDWAVYHTGKGRDWGCRYTLAIEICSNISTEKYEEAEDRAISLIYSLQHKYQIPNEMIFFHQDWNERTYCPKTALDNYGNSVNFVYQRIGGE